MPKRAKPASTVRFGRRMPYSSAKTPSTSPTRSRSGRGRYPASYPTCRMSSLLHRGKMWPQIMTVPVSGVTTPRIMSRVVVLPAPFGPSRATRSDERIVRSTPSTAGTPRNAFCRPRATRTSSTSTRSDCATGGAGQAAHFPTDPLGHRSLGVAQHGQQLGRRDRRAQVVTLGLVAAELGQPLPGDLVLDALGHHPQPEVMGQLDGRAHDHGVVVVHHHPCDEGV